MDTKSVLDLMESVRKSAHELALRTDAEGDWNNLQSLDYDIMAFKQERLKLSLGVARMGAVEKVMRHLVTKWPMVLDRRPVDYEWLLEFKLKNYYEFMQDFKYAVEGLLQIDKEYFSGLFSKDRTDHQDSDGDAREQ